MEPNDLKWNPCDVWRVLRLSPEYRKAIDDFKVELDKTARRRSRVSKSVKSAFKAVSREDQIPQGMSDRAFAALRRKELAFPKHRNLHTGIDIAIADLGSLACGRKFLELYGDVLLFPIDYESKFPNEFLLSSIWALKPAVMSSRRIQNSVGLIANEASEASHIKSLRQLSILINLDFSEGQIADAIANVVRNLLKEQKVKKVNSERQAKLSIADSLKAFERFRPKWSKIDSLIAVAEMRIEGAKRRSEVAKSLSWDKRTGDKHSEVGTDTQMGKRRVTEQEKYVRQLLQFFSRK